jgi:hypothetical protein
MKESQKRNFATKKREKFFKQGFRSSRIRSILSTHRQQQQQIEAKKTLYHNNPHLKRQKEEDRKGEEEERSWVRF